tara:strand:+ start:1234 stop:2679 length:1446 start_codon:yes stop_codon:yes gene_type:complete
MSEEIQNEEEIVVEDVQEEDLVENQELVQDTPEEVAEESQESLSDSVLDVLLGEAKKKNEAEDGEDEEESDDEESDDDEDEEMEEAVEVDEETIEESSEETEEESIEESSEEVEEETLEEGVQTKAGILADAFSTIKSYKKHDLTKAYEAMMQGDDDEEEEMEEEDVDGEKDAAANAAAIKKSAPPKTKAEMINAMYHEMKKMKKDDLMAAYGAIKSAMDDEEEEEMEEAFATDLKVLADADSNLTEDFKTKASTLFEAAVANKVATIKEDLENTYEDSLQEEIVYIRETLIEKIDNYLTYVVEDWMSENQEYVDNKLRTDIAEDFMKNLKELFVESYIEVPESKVDLVDSLSEDVEATKSELLTVSEERDSLASQIEELQREKIISEATSELTSTQSSKFVKLLEGIEFVDASSFETKVSVIKESFFNEEEPKQELEEEVSSDETEIIVEGEGDPNAELSPTMQKYLSSLSRIQHSIHNK